MKSLLRNRSWKLVRNALLILLGLFALWILFGMPALTKEQAFRRAMREHYLPPKDPQIFFETDGEISALAEVDGIYVQTVITKQGISWKHDRWSETEASEGIYIVPLMASGRNQNSPEVAVLAEGDRADLTFIYKGETHLLQSMGKQDGWFLFRFFIDSDSAEARSDYYYFVFLDDYKSLDTPYKYRLLDPCSFLFVSYDKNGNELLRTEKHYQ